jgi:hypothetical protein
MHNTIFVQHEETMLWMISFLDPFQTNRNIPVCSVKARCYSFLGWYKGITESRAP